MLSMGEPIGRIHTKIDTFFLRFDDSRKGRMSIDERITSADVKPKSWIQATRDAIRRVTLRKSNQIFTRKELLAELPTIVMETKSYGATPGQTLSRVMQSLRDNGEVRFLEGRPPTYELITRESVEGTPLSAVGLAPSTERFTWRDATIRALRRYVEKNPQREQITLAELASQELSRIIQETGTKSTCPIDTLETTLKKISSEHSSPVIREAPKKYHIRKFNG